MPGTWFNPHAHLHPALLKENYYCHNQVQREEC